jgi:molybdopterin-containing oxidoreductase family membrane subunit
MSKPMEEDALLFRPIEKTGTGFYLSVGILLGVIALAIFLYIRQVYFGLGATGMNQPVTWGFYIVNFVFFIGISHAGTLISAILRLSNAEWRRPITRMAEVITAIVLAIGAVHPFIDLGRPDRVVTIFLTGRLQSPLLWDVTAITTYFTASTIYLYVPMIPDIATLRDRGTRPHWLYEFLAWGWQGTARQQKVLERAITILMVMVIPIAVSVHTVISYIFSMTLQPMWHSTIFGPYFVVGAILSGIAALLLAMLAFRKIFRLEAYLKEIHFVYLGRLLVIMSFLWFYFTFSEYLTAYFGHQPHEMKAFFFKVYGPYAPLFWSMVLCNFVIPVFILSFKKTRKISGIFVASVAVLIGMWLERLLIIVPTLSNPRLSSPLGVYIPTFTEWWIFAGAISTFILGFLLFSKFFPIISIWEVREGRAISVKEVTERIKTYLPETT